jgi:acyl-CoA synthetase (AMP-forming)/AMP-acid ligase II
MTTPTTLLDLLSSAPADQTAIILPEQNIRVTYGGLRQQIEAVAETLAAAGINRGDRVGMALPNGLPTIVGFLAYCRERLSDYKRPKQIHITDAISRTATGKIQRRVVAEAYSQKAS